MRTDKDRKYGREWQRKWRAKNPELAKQKLKDWINSHPLLWKKHQEKSRRKRRLIQQLAIEEDQGVEVCGICKTNQKRLYTDHNHKTDQVRGRLCPSCNSGLGQFKDNPVFLSAAIEYLLKSKTYGRFIP